MRHELIEQRSLAMDRLIAAKIRREPALLDRANAVLAQWIEAREASVPRVMLEWREILQRPLNQILELLEADTEDARRLRQSSSFCGILTEEERSDIFREFERAAYAERQQAHLTDDLGYSPHAARSTVAELCGGQIPICPTCKLELGVVGESAADPWSSEHLGCPLCNGTFADWRHVLEVANEAKAKGR